MGNFSDKTDMYCNVDIANLKLIGQGCQGRVYLLPDNKVIKVFKHSHSCTDQLRILRCGDKSRFFPKVYDSDKYSIIMDLVQGTPFIEYLENHSINENLSFEIVKLIEDFKSLGFTRLDIRLGHIFVLQDLTIKIIDPRGNFKILQEYPMLLLRGLKNLGLLDEFFLQIKQPYPEIYNTWKILSDLE